MCAECETAFWDAEVHGRQLAFEPVQRMRAAVPNRWRGLGALKLGGGRPGRLGNFGFRYTTNFRIINDVFVDLQRLMKYFDLAKIDFNIRRGGVY